MKKFLETYGALIGLVVWVLIWGLGFMRVNHPIEDPYVSVGVMFGWLWGLVFGCRVLNWGVINHDAETRKAE